MSNPFYITIIHKNISTYQKMILAYMIKKMLFFFFSQWLQCWMPLLVICGGSNNNRILYWNILITLCPFNYVVTTFPLHCLGHRIKYGNPEAENTIQLSFPKTRPYCSIAFFKSFWLWVSLVTYNIGVFI